MTYEIIWEFRVRPEQIAAFEAAYGPDGVWVKLFRTAEGFIETRLLSDCEEAGRYLTMDSWASADAFEAFRRNRKDDYQTLDRDLEALCADERRIGAFTR